MSETFVVRGNPELLAEYVRLLEAEHQAVGKQGLLGNGDDAIEAWNAVTAFRQEHGL